MPVIFIIKLSDVMEVKLLAGDLLPPKGASKSPAKSLSKLQAHAHRWPNKHDVPACTWMYFVMCRIVLLVLWCPRHRARLGYGVTCTHNRMGPCPAGAVPD